MTEAKEDDTDSQSQDTGVVIYARRKPGRPKKYQTEDERRIAKNGKWEFITKGIGRRS